MVKNLHKYYDGQKKDGLNTWVDQMNCCLDLPSGKACRPRCWGTVGRRLQHSVLLGFSATAGNSLIQGQAPGRCLHCTWDVKGQPSAQLQTTLKF